MSSHHPQHTGHEMSRSCAHQGDGMGKGQGGHQDSEGESPQSDRYPEGSERDYPVSLDQIVKKATAAHADRGIVHVLRLPSRRKSEN